MSGEIPVGEPAEAIGQIRKRAANRIRESSPASGRNEEEAETTADAKCPRSGLDNAENARRFNRETTKQLRLFAFIRPGDGGGLPIQPGIQENGERTGRLQIRKVASRSRGESGARAIDGTG